MTERQVSPMAKKDKKCCPEKKETPPADQAKDILTDPLGSYTGRPADGGKPQQDADDL